MTYLHRRLDRQGRREWLFWTVALAVPLAGYGSSWGWKDLGFNALLSGVLAFVLLPWLSTLRQRLERFGRRVG